MRPLVHFLVLGACLFGLMRWVESAGGPVTGPARETITIGAERVAEIRRQAEIGLGRSPDRAELEALIEAEVAEEILYREARALGLAESDPVVRERLLQNMRFFRGEDADPDSLYREALALGLDQSDLVVRRRLIQRMRFGLENQVRAEPENDALLAYRARHPERFSTPRQVRLSQVFFDPERRGGAAEADAHSALGAEPPGPGDPFLVPRDLSLSSERGLEKLFGPEFARAALEASVGVWSGPLRSSHGHHLVFVHERIAGAPLPFETVRRVLRLALLAEQRRQAVHDGVARLRRSYDVTVEPDAL